MGKSIVFIDIEVGVDDKKIHDLGAVRNDRATFHSASLQDFSAFISGSEYLCGHNIVRHDMKYIKTHISSGISNKYIDTLYLSPITFS